MTRAGGTQVRQLASKLGIAPGIKPPRPGSAQPARRAVAKKMLGAARRPLTARDHGLVRDEWTRTTIRTSFLQPTMEPAIEVDSDTDVIRPNAAFYASVTQRLPMVLAMQPRPFVAAAPMAAGPALRSAPALSNGLLLALAAWSIMAGMVLSVVVAALVYRV